MKKYVAWDAERRLSFAVPFREMKPVIYLDVFLPRVTELALSASDRQTKVFPASFYSLFIFYFFKNINMLVEKQTLCISSSNITFKCFQKWISLIDEN
jgi:DNA-dependent protein kinase catalytic subunit